MAEAHKFSTLAKALEVFPELTWAQDAEGGTYVDNSKTGERVAVSKGQHIVKIAGRYEVRDEAPENAKTAEKPKAEAQPESAPASPGNPQVAPEAVGAPAGSPEAEAAPAADTNAAAAE